VGLTEGLPVPEIAEPSAESEREEEVVSYEELEREEEAAPYESAESGAVDDDSERDAPPLSL